MRRRRSSITARGVATVRARLDRSSSPTGDVDAATRFNDSLRLPVPLHWHRTLRRYLQARTEFFDQCVIDAVTSGVDQVVTIGAGYDDRALRMRSSDTRFIEVDHPATQADKRDRLLQLSIEPPATFVAVDLNAASLAEALRPVLIAGCSSLFVLEAVLPYLPLDRVESVITDLRSLASERSSLTVDLATRPGRRSARAAMYGLRLAARRAGEPIHTVFAVDDAQRLLTDRGWTIDEATDIGQSGVRALDGASLFVVAHAGALDLP